MKIRNLIFDLGNVLVDFPWREYLHGFGYAPETEERIAKALFLGRSWREADRGALTDEEIYQECRKEIPDLEDALRPVWEGRTGIVTVYGYTEEWLKQLKASGYRIYILSNYAGTTFRALEENSRFLEAADGRVISYEVCSIKPEPAIYEELLRRYGIRPEESLYLDDLPENIEAGRRFGFHTIRFDGWEQAKQEMRRYRVEWEEEEAAI